MMGGQGNAFIRELRGRETATKGGWGEHNRRCINRGRVNEEGQKGVKVRSTVARLLAGGFKA